MQKKKKEITLDDLAGMVKYGFDGVDKRFDKIEEPLDRIEHLILSEHKQRIQVLEREVHKIKELFAMS
ncbi:hypothetical protein HYV71_04065 [Candidatus Uhrbacteria bacterium]|nr:hypothetical protein [Candidatus Uhrbacteria bacterium]